MTATVAVGTHPIGMDSGNISHCDNIQFLDSDFSGRNFFTMPQTTTNTNGEN